MATSDYFSSADLKAVEFGGDGWIREDVMQQIWDISAIPLPLQDRIGSDGVKNAYTEWNEDKLADPDLDNAAVDGEDADPADNKARGGSRIGNHCQISTKLVIVTERANASDTMGGNALSYQVMQRQRELRRDMEAIMLSGQASQADDGNATPGKLGALGAAITQGDRIGTGGGFSNGAWAAFAPGAKRGLTETMVRNVSQMVWEEGGMPTVFMSTPPVVRALSEYMFTASARIATMTAETHQKGPATAMGSVNVFLTDFGVTLDLVPNRLQQPYDSGGGTPDAASAFILDPDYLRVGTLKALRTEPLAKTGLSEKREMAVDYTLKILNRSAHGIISDLDPTVPVQQAA